MSTRSGPNAAQRAFTLIELMISIALVLALMIGVNYVFSSVGKATGLTQASSRAMRDAQGTQSVMYRDFFSADMTNAPFVVIRSFPTPAFRNRTDYASTSMLPDPLQDVSGTHSLTEVNDRVHRTDTLMFFSRDKFQRQTGGGTFNGTPIEPYLADMTTQEAMIWYGHLRLPDDSSPSTVFLSPGQPPLAANPNNFFGVQWILGRFAMLLQEEVTSNIKTRKAVTVGGAPTGAYDDTLQWHIKDFTQPLEPLRYDAISDPAGWHIDDSRYDLAGTNMALMTGKMTPAMLSSPWWNLLMSRMDNPSDVHTLRRFHARPFSLGAAGQRLKPEDLALQAPIFISNCSQFIVEFAGDFLQQNATGNVTGAGQDGEIDFFYDSATQSKRVRWYGFPRDVNGDGVIRADKGDVVPVSNVNNGTALSFEKDLNNTLIPSSTANADYANMTVTQLAASNQAPGYTCAWGPGDKKPSMFRITIAIDDPNGRFADPLTFEYVFKVPG